MFSSFLIGCTTSLTKGIASSDAQSLMFLQFVPFYVLSCMSSLIVHLTPSFGDLWPVLWLKIVSFDVFDTSFGFYSFLWSLDFSLIFELTTFFSTLPFLIYLLSLVIDSTLTSHFMSSPTQTLESEAFHLGTIWSLASLFNHCTPHFHFILALFSRSFRKAPSSQWLVQ